MKAIMKAHPFTRLLGALAVIGWTSVALVQAENTAAVDEILKLKNAGVSDETIVSYIKSKDINYGLSADDILALHGKGVSPGVLNAMVASGGVSAPGVPPAAPAAAATGVAPTA
jgi:hypothetical protein